VKDSTSHAADDKSSMKGAWTGSCDTLSNFTLPEVSLYRLKLETSVATGRMDHDVAMWVPLHDLASRGPELTNRGP